MNPKILIPVAVVAIAAAAFAINHSRSAKSGDSNMVSLSGNIEITDAQLAFKIPGKVERRLVDEGDRVRKGQVVAELDSGDLKQQLDIRRGELAVVQAALAELKAGTRPEEIAAARAQAQQAEAALLALQHGSRPQEIAAARARVSAARAESNKQAASFRRGKELFESKTISAQEFDQFRQAHETADARLKEAQDQLNLVQEGPRKEDIEQAQAKLRQAQAQLKLAVEGPRKEDIDQAEAQVRQAQATVNLAQTQYDYATISSPLSGIVLSKNIEPGEYVSPGTPVITVGDLANVWLRGYINETDLGRVKVGQAATITTDTYPGKQYEGRVSFISSEAEFTPKNIQTEKERVKLVYRIKINIANPNIELKPGMPADAEIRIAR